MHAKKIFVVLLTLSLVLAACAPAGAPAPEAAAPAEDAAAPAGPAEQVLIGGFDVGPGGDPQGVLYNNGAGNTWFVKMFTLLIMMSSDFSEHTSDGALAVDWSPNEDATVWTFNLREGVKWHDGEDFTASDLKWTAEFVSAPQAAVTHFGIGQADQIVGWSEYNSGEADEIAGIRAVDDLTLEIELSAPNPRFYDAVRGFYALPEHAIDFEPTEIFNADWWFTSPVGTGPFKFGAFEKDQFMELVPNELYWDGAPKLEKLVNRYFVDETAAVLALESGDIDFSYVSADVASRFEGNPDYQIFSGPSFVTNMFNYNYENDVWKDKRIRQAIMYGIDRASIVSDVFNGTAQATPCQDPYPQFWPEDANYYEYNPDKARELLAEAAADGVTLDGINLDIPTYYTSQLAKDILTVMQANLADVGVNVNPTFLDVPTWRTVVDDNTAEWNIAYRGAGGGPASYGSGWYVEETATRSQQFVQDEAYVDLWAAMDAAQTPEDYKAARTAICKYQNEEATLGYWWVSTRYGIAAIHVADFHYFPAPGGGPFVDNSQEWNIK
ncbi:ABC transporter substrate-binding protein [Chloroflexi bacterium TSY]|nr:ABC transporter substrate-binding protein [Chloroflexi bacterium TSY]